jgi:hypothetical protein
MVDQSDISSQGGKGFVVIRAGALLRCPAYRRLRRVLTSEIQTAALPLLQCVRLFRSLR